MPVISARMIHRPRRARWCECCGKRIDGPQLRLYGCGLPGDKPYAVYMHRECTDSVDVTRKLGLPGESEP